jgi:signal peptidase
MSTTHLVEEPSAATRTGPLWWARQIVSWLLLIVALVVLLAVIGVPRMTGATPYTVLTGSMQPIYPPGTLIVVKKVPVDDLAIGTVITYQKESAKAAVITHRIIAVNRNARGEKTFVTQGDANNIPDPEVVRPQQIRGEVWYSLPYLGRVNTMISGSQHAVLLTAAVSGLLLYAAFMFYTGHRHARRERTRT